MVRPFLALAFTTLLLTAGCSFFFPVPPGVEAEVEPSQGLSQMGEQFTPGEKWLADVTIGGIVAGKVTFTVGEPCRQDGRLVHTLRSTGRSTGLLALLKRSESDSRSLVDAVTGRPIRTLADVIDSDKEKHFEVRYEDGEYESWYARPEKKTQQRTRKYATRDVPHDFHTAIGMLRRWRPEEGTRAHFFEVIGRKQWRVDIVLVGTETLDTEFGPMETVRIDGLATRILKDLQPSSRKPRAFSIWFSEDERRLPIRLVGETKIADVQLDLVDYELPDHPLTRAEDFPEIPADASCPGLVEPGIQVASDMVGTSG